MRLTVNVDCTPEEARAFLGLPDISSLNEMLVERVKAQAESNLDLLDPAEMMKSWMSFGGMLQQQFAEAMATAAAGVSGSETKSEE